MKTNVLKKTADKFVPAEAHIMEMNFADYADAKALSDIRFKWIKGEFTEMITFPSYSPNRKIYALTTQKDNFDKPDADKILGLADFFISGKDVNGNFMQADPGIIKSKDRQVKGIGKSLFLGIIKELKKMGMENLYMYIDDEVKPFYNKLPLNIEKRDVMKNSYTNHYLKL